MSRSWFRAPTGAKLGGTRFHARLGDRTFAARFLSQLRLIGHPRGRQTPSLWPCEPCHARPDPHLARVRRGCPVPAVWAVLREPKQLRTSRRLVRRGRTARGRPGLRRRAAHQRHQRVPPQTFTSASRCVYQRTDRSVATELPEQRRRLDRRAPLIQCVDQRRFGLAGMGAKRRLSGSDLPLVLAVELDIASAINSSVPGSRVSSLTSSTPSGSTSPQPSHRERAHRG